MANNMQADVELLRLYASERSETAFAELVRRHVNLVYGAALRQLGGDAHAAEDVTQAVFTDLARKAAAIAGREVIASWLYTSTRFAAANARRARGRRYKHETEAELMRAIETTSPPATDWEKLRPLVDDAMHELSERDRGVVVLRFFQSRPFAEIGEAYGLSEDAARMRVERALGRLRALLVRRGITSTSAALSAVLMAHTAVAAPVGLASSVTGAALAGAATTATGSAGALATAGGVVTFMSTAKIAATVAVVGGLAGVGFGFLATQQRRAAEESARTLVSERNALQARLSESEARAKAAEARTAEVQRAVAASPGKPATAPAGAPAAPASDPEAVKARLRLDAATKAMEEKLTMMANPEVQRSRLEMERLGLGIRYAQFYHRLNLTPEQIARFEARWTESRQEAADIFAVAKTNGVAPNDPGIMRIANDAKAKFETDLSAILGPSGFAEFQRYERSYPAREIVSSMMGNLVSAGAPLNATQIDQLTLAIAEQSSGYQKGERVGDKAGDVNWNAAIARAQQFLTAAQIDVLRAHAAHAQASQVAAETIMKVAPKSPASDRGAARKPTGG